MARQYTASEIAEFKEKIVDGIWSGNSLKNILETNKQLPSRRYVYEWLNKENDRYDAEFDNNYTRARVEGADLDSDRIEELNNELRRGEITPHQARVMLDALKWSAGRKNSKKYGEKSSLDVTSDGKEITQQVVQFQLPDNNRDKKG